MHYNIQSINIGILDGHQIAKSIILNTELGESYYSHKNFDLMRGLGFKDINGREIFEKDMVAVEYNKGTIAQTTIEVALELYGRKVPMEIIGNAYEPPCIPADTLETSQGRAAEVFGQ